MRTVVGRGSKIPIIYEQRSYIEGLLKEKQADLVYEKLKNRKDIYLYIRRPDRVMMNGTMRKWMNDKNNGRLGVTRIKYLDVPENDHVEYLKMDYGPSHEIYTPDEEKGWFVSTGYNKKSLMNSESMKNLLSTMKRWMKHLRMDDISWIYVGVVNYCSKESADEILNSVV